ncbi:MAG: undecaprenyl/decaprenyl-phosphate alpha-N-acetylglucosaminyl 1-phosphate transferase [Clostridia bacterium]|nr:undecaprenyl/decaprenyl-phosphate alpha-N-acetylglucosaminyl 1-phosphate transferase [Clostridia bacterium]
MFETATYQSIVTLLIAILCAFLITFTTTPIARVIAFKVGAIDIPKDKRRMHKEPIPRMGGLAIFLGFAITVIVFLAPTKEINGMLLGALLLVVTGIFDDIYSLPALFKLFLQLAASTIAVLMGNVINSVTIFGNYINFGNFAIPLSVIWITALINAVNLIDGLDGLSCGVSAISSVSMLFSAFFLPEPSFAIILLIASLAGACIGFLPFNFNPASIFMGDTGAMFLGYSLAIISIQGFFKIDALLSFWIPFLVFALPILDTSFAFTRRILHGRSPFSADRGHIHHKLIDMGFSQKQSVMILYSICGILGVSAVLFAMDRPIEGISVIFVALFIYLLNWIFVNKNPETREHMGMGLSPQPGTDTENNENKTVEE